MILFRVDGNPDIGMGHIMRCLSIADVWREQKESCLFAVADDYFSDVIQAHGHKVFFLNTDYRDMLSDLDIMNEFIKKQKPLVLFTDSYQVSYIYMNELWETCKTVNCKLIYIDDFLAFAYHCDILLNYNIYGLDKKNEYRKLYHEKNIMCPHLLLGTRYAPLRAEFRCIEKRKVKKYAYSILILTGGSDPDHIAKRFVRYIVENSAKLPDLYFHFVIGVMNYDRSEIEKLAEQNSCIILHYNVQHMRQLMYSVDLAISAAGFTLYELCATQTPTITYILADNQVLGAKKFDEERILCCVGDARKLGEELIKILLEEAIKLAENYKKRVKIAENQRLIVDGNGAERIIKEIY